MYDMLGEEVNCPKPTNDSDRRVQPSDLQLDKSLDHLARDANMSTACASFTEWGLQALTKQLINTIPKDGNKEFYTEIGPIMKAVDRAVSHFSYHAHRLKTNVRLMKRDLRLKQEASKTKSELRVLPIDGPDPMEDVEIRAVLRDRVSKEQQLSPVRTQSRRPQGTVTGKGNLTSSQAASRAKDSYMYNRKLLTKRLFDNKRKTSTKYRRDKQRFPAKRAHYNKHASSPRAKGKASNAGNRRY